MANATARTPADKPRLVPLDLRTMKESVLRLIGPSADLPSMEELETLILLLRGHIMLLIPEVEIQAGQLPKDDVPRACALACIGEAQMRLRLEPSGNLPQHVAHGQRLARSVNALVDHYENLRGAA